ncbi:neutral zinc metallopeptidase [Aestuariivirga sp.]|uniref:KPN_02809 family neutral zinc metallopeptidase n=1 Tax=Aestuariivirga sp. TaxID=2650926 RepID=UPI003594735F
MRLDNEKPDYDSIEDRRGQGGGGGFGFPGGGRGGRINIPMGGSRAGGFSFKTIIFLVIVYFVLKAVFGIDLLQMINGGGVPVPGGGTDTQITVPDTRTDVTDSGDTNVGIDPGTSTADAGADAGKEFVARVLGSNNRVWDEIFTSMNATYQKPKLVLFEGFVQSACGAAQSAMGPFYCPGDQKVYIDLSFYQDLKSKLGAPGDFAQAYVIAHEVGHHVQNLLGIADKVTQARMRASKEEANALSVRMELQADCFSGIWAQEANASKRILEEGDIEEGLNAAAAIGDDRLQKRSQGYVVPESFTHGTSAQRVSWFKKGFTAKSLRDCDTFSASSL